MNGLPGRSCKMVRNLTISYTWKGIKLGESVKWTDVCARSESLYSFLGELNQGLPEVTDIL